MVILLGYKKYKNWKNRVSVFFLKRYEAPKLKNVMFKMIPIVNKVSIKKQNIADLALKVNQKNIAGKAKFQFKMVPKNKIFQLSSY